MLDDLDEIPFTHRLRWIKHAERSSSWLKKVQKLQKLKTIGDRERGGRKKTWSEVIRLDCLRQV